MTQRPDSTFEFNPTEDTTPQWTDADMAYVMHRQWWKGFSSGVVITLLTLSFLILLGWFTDF